MSKASQHRFNSKFWIHFKTHNDFQSNLFPLSIKKVEQSFDHKPI